MIKKKVILIFCLRSHLFLKKKEKVIFIFVVRHLVPSKMVMYPKIIFRCYFGKYCFIRKNYYMKNIQKVNANKNGYIDFCHQTPLSLQNGQVLPQMGFWSFLQKYCFY